MASQRSIARRKRLKRLSKANRKASELPAELSALIEGLQARAWALAGMEDDFPTVIEVVRTGRMPSVACLPQMKRELAKLEQLDRELGN